jgi:antitoxin component of RelBE/YafQ-DinJ toxin-antitoxin module
MQQDSKMTFRVNKDLRTEFTQATEKNNISAPDALREFMRDYVAWTNQQLQSKLNEKTLSTAEFQRRKSAVNFARASVNLEGLSPSETAEKFALSFINGEIDLAEFVAMKFKSSR